MDIIEQLRERHGMGAGAERGGVGRDRCSWIRSIPNIKSKLSVIIAKLQHYLNFCTLRDPGYFVKRVSQTTIDFFSTAFED